MIPVQGQIVAYMVTAEDAERINKRRNDTHRSKISKRNWGTILHVGNPARAGEVYPMMVLRIVDDTDDHAKVNGQVFLDGTDVLWVTDAEYAPIVGDWSVPEPGDWFLYNSIEP